MAVYPAGLHAPKLKCSLQGTIIPLQVTGDLTYSSGQQITLAYTWGNQRGLIVLRRPARDLIFCIRITLPQS